MKVYKKQTNFNSWKFKVDTLKANEQQGLLRKDFCVYIFVWVVTCLCACMPNPVHICVWPRADGVMDWGGSCGAERRICLSLDDCVLF